MNKSGSARLAKYTSRWVLELDESHSEKVIDSFEIYNFLKQSENSLQKGVFYWCCFVERVWLARYQSHKSLITEASSAISEFS